MPGKRYNYRITASPWKGTRARIVKQDTLDSVIIEIQGEPQQHPIHTKALVRLQNKTPRRPRPQAQHRPRRAPAKSAGGTRRKRTPK